MARVVQISDTHLLNEPTMTDHGDPDVSLRATIDAVRDVHPDLVLLTGDIADDGSLEALRRVRDLVAELPAPIMALAGNHDDLDNVHVVFGSKDTVEVGAWRIVAVESSIPGEIHGSVDVDALVGRLDRLDDRPTLIAIHHPPLSPSTHPWFQLIGAETLLAVLSARAHVRAIASGHLHEAFDRFSGDLAVCSAPSSLYAIEHNGEDFRWNDDGVVGCQVLTLGDQGAFSCERVSRSLG
ncbi:MAG: 3,5-cyclic-AMP phosphodiesterase [Ilumatobacteraceae bacterium]|jgi:Icc protein